MTLNIDEVKEEKSEIIKRLEKIEEDLAYIKAKLDDMLDPMRK